MTSEFELVQRAQRGDREAFGELVVRHQPLIYRLCARMVGRADAEELAQETFLRAFVGRGKLDPARPLRPYLATIARRLCIDLLRKKRPTLTDDASDAFPDEAAADLEQSSDAQRQLAALTMAVERLSPNAREVVQLFHVEGLSYREIAGVMDVPIGTVMTWLHRARAQLRQTVFATQTGTAACTRAAPGGS